MSLYRGLCQEQGKYIYIYYILCIMYYVKDRLVNLFFQVTLEVNTNSVYQRECVFVADVAHSVDSVVVPHSQRLVTQREYLYIINREKEAWLLQKGRAMLRVVEDFTKSLMVTQRHSKLHRRVRRVPVAVDIALQIRLYLYRV